MMKIRLIVMPLLALLLTGCAGEYNKVLKSSDLDYRYEYAKQSFAEGKFNQAAILLQDLITAKKGSDEAEESLYMLGMSDYMNGDFESAAATFRKYYQTYPRGIYARRLPLVPSTPISSSSISSQAPSCVRRLRTVCSSCRTSWW